MSSAIDPVMLSGVFAGSPMQAGANQALQAVNQMAGSTNLSQGEFVQIYQNMLMTQSFANLFKDPDDDSDDSGGGFGVPNMQDLFATMPGLLPHKNLEISHVEIDGNTGKVVYKDGSTATVPIQAAKTE